MRIAIVSTQRGWRGGEHQAEMLARGLTERGHEVLVCAPGNAPLSHRLADAGVRIEDLSRPASPLTLNRIRQRLRRWRPDVLHCNDARALSTVGTAAAGLPIPVRVTSRRVDYPVRNPWMYRWLGDRTICVSRAVRQRCCDAGLPTGDLAVVPDGVDPGRLLPRRPRPAPATHPVLLAVGALVAEKGHVDLLRALPHVLRTHPGTTLSIAGAGPEREALQRVAVRLEVDTRVRFLGQRHDVPRLLAEADLFAHPSVREGLSTALIEAMLAGLPIVATATGGVPELFDLASDRPAARLVPCEDPVALAEGITRSLSVPHDSAARAARAQRHARTHFTAAQMVERTLAVYTEIQARRVSVG